MEFLHWFLEPVSVTRILYFIICLYTMKGIMLGSKYAPATHLRYGKHYWRWYRDIQDKEFKKSTDYKDWLIEEQSKLNAVK